MIVDQRLPRQPDDKRGKLLGVECYSYRTLAIGPDKTHLFQAPGGQPDAEAVIDEDLHACRSAVGKQVRVMRAGRSKYPDHVRQRRVGTGAHVQRRSRQPDSVDPDHRNQPCSQDAQWAAAEPGQRTVTSAAPRRTSITMSCMAGADAGLGNCSGINSGGETVIA